MKETHNCANCGKPIVWQDLEFGYDALLFGGDGHEARWVHEGDYDVECYPSIWFWRDRPERATPIVSEEKIIGDKGA